MGSKTVNLMLGFWVVFRGLIRNLEEGEKNDICCFVLWVWIFDMVWRIFLRFWMAQEWPKKGFNCSVAPHHDT